MKFDLLMKAPVPSDALRQKHSVQTGEGIRSRKSLANKSAMKKFQSTAKSSELSQQKEDFLSFCRSGNLRGLLWYLLHACSLVRNLAAQVISDTRFGSISNM